MKLTIEEQSPQYLGIEEACQFNFHFNDETRAVAFLKRHLCPLCHSTPVLWRICQPGERPTFQVRCPGNDLCRSPIITCTQLPIPNPAIEDSRGAVRAWSLACKLAQ